MHLKNYREKTHDIRTLICIEIWHILMQRKRNTMHSTQLIALWLCRMLLDVRWGTRPKPKLPTTIRIHSWFYYNHAWLVHNKKKSRWDEKKIWKFAEKVFNTRICEFDGTKRMRRQRWICRSLLSTGISTNQPASYIYALYAPRSKLSKYKIKIRGKASMINANVHRKRRTVEVGGGSKI